MKKLLFRGAMLLLGVASALNASAEKRYMQQTSNGIQWTVDHRVYLEIDSEDLSEVAKALWQEALSDEAKKWTTNIPDPKEAAELTDAIVQIPLPEGSWTYDVESEVAAQINTDAFRTQMAEVVNKWMLGKVLMFKNVGRNRYLCTNPDAGTAFGSHINVNSNSFWHVIPAEGGFKLKNHNGYYVTSAPGISLNENDAVTMTLRIPDGQACWLSPATNQGNYLHSNVNATAASAVAVWAGTNGDFSRWYIYGCDFAASLQSAKNDFQRYVDAGLFTETERNNVFAEMDEVELSVDAATTYQSIVNEAWRDLEGKAIVLQFNQLSAYITAVENGENTELLGPAELTFGGVWQIKDLEFNSAEIRFYLYNPATKLYLGDYLTANADTKWIFAWCFASGYTDHLVIKSCNRASNRCIINSNGNIAWGTDGNQGSALKVKRGEVFAPSFKYNDVVLASTGKWGSRAKNINESIDNADNDDDLISAISDAVNLPGVYITLTSSRENPNSGKAFRYTTDKNGDEKMIVTDANEESDVQSIWYYSPDNKMASYYRGMYVGADESNFVAMNTEAKSNNATSIHFTTGYQEEGTVQMVFNGTRGANVNEQNGTYFIDACDVANTEEVKNEPAHNWVMKPVESLPVAVHSDGWGSFYCPVAYKIPALDVTKYTFYGAKQSEKGATVLDILSANTVLAGGTAIIFKGEANKTVNFELEYEEAGNSDYTSVFEGTHIAQLHTHPDNMATFSKVEQTSVASVVALNSEDDSQGSASNRSVNLSKLGAEKPVYAMLYTVSKDDQDILDTDESTFVLRVSDITTGIEEITVEKAVSASGVYDLQGRKLAAPLKGVNIINGKKVLVK